MRSSELASAMAALDNMIDERNVAQQMVNVLNSSVHRLTIERDEARREVCALEADTIEDQREYAKQRGWNCFGPNTCKEAHNAETDKDPG